MELNFTRYANTTFIEEIVKNATTEDCPDCSDRPFSAAAVIVSAAILIPLAVIGIVGNGLTIAVVMTSKTLDSIFNIFILSLSFSDVMSALNSPIGLYLRTWGFKWELPNFFCKFYWALDMMTSFATSHHILIYSFLRLLSLIKPHEFKKLTRKHTTIIIFTIWTVCFATGFVFYFWWFGAQKRTGFQAKWPECIVLPEWMAANAYYVNIAFPLHFYLPLLGIVFFCSWTAITIWKSKRLRRMRALSSGGNGRRKNAQGAMGKKERAAILQLGLIVGSYLLGYLPLTVYVVITMFTKAVTPRERQNDWTARMIAYIAMRISECLNPLFYNLASNKMRKATLQFLAKCGIVRSQMETSRVDTTKDLPTSRRPAKSVSTKI